MNGVFVTGTDTDAGKTFASSLIIQALVQRGLSVAALKPIASGFELDNGQWKNADVQALTLASNVDLPAECVNRYAFKPAISPHIAAYQHDQTLNLDCIYQDVQFAAERSDFVLVEGVGGWHVPLVWPQAGHACVDIQQLALSLGLPIIMVVGLRLGCLNHAILTANAILQSGLPCLGWVANHVDRDFDCAEENLATLDAVLPVPRLIEIPFMDDPASVDLNDITQSDFIKELSKCE